MNRNSLSFNIYLSDLNDTDLHKETLVFKRICTTSLKSDSKNRKELIPLYTSTPAFPKYPCNEQAVITIMPLLGRPPQDEKWSLRGGILGGNINILDTADRPAAWPARKKSNRPFLLRASLPTAPQRVAFIPHTTTFFAQANGHLSAISPLLQKTALLADKAELVTTGTCLQSGSVYCFDLADGAAADSTFSTVT